MTKEYGSKRNSKEYKDIKKQKIYEKNVKFCRAVQSQPCLYDRTKSQLPKDINAAWRAVSAMSGATAVACKLRWQNIRFAFIRSLQTTNNRPPNRYRKYYLHDVLEFFIPHIPTNYNSASEDEIKDAEESNGERSRKTKNTTRAQIDDDYDEERTTSANETEENDQRAKSTSSNKNKDNSFAVKDQKGRNKEKNVKKMTKDDEESNYSDYEELHMQENSDESLGEHVKSLRVKLKKMEAAKNAAEDAKGEDVEENIRQFRFQRACKRSIDKSIVQQLSSPSPKREMEPKRTRRSLSARRATQKVNLEAKTAMAVSPPTITEKSAKKGENEKQHKAQGKQKPVTVQDTRPNSEPLLALSSFIPSDIVETELKTSSSEEPSVVIEWSPPPTIAAATNQLTANDATPKKSCVSFVLPASLLKIDRAVQCDRELQRSANDDEFLQLLRPQMAAMNARQKLYFKQKIYKSLVEVFDDSTNFPNSNDFPDASAFPVPPFPGVGATTGAEMCLIRELVSLVQAAKLTPELRNDRAAQGQGREAEVIKTTTATTLSANQAATSDMPAFNYKNSPPPLVEPGSKKIVIQSKDPFMERQMMRKLVKVNGVVNNLREGEKRRIFRILPKGATHSVSSPQTSTSSVGTFIIPRVPGSIASSVNAAVASAYGDAYNASDKNYREINVSGNKIYVSPTAANGLNGSGSGTRRMMTTRCSIRPSGTSMPRQVMRRYSVCGNGAGNNSSIDNRRSGRVPNIAEKTLPNTILNSNNTMPTVRFVRALGTETPPFKQSQQPMTRVNQYMTTKTTSSKLKDILSDTPDVSSSMLSDVEMQTLPITGFSTIFSNSTSTTSTAFSNTLNNTSLVKSPIKTISSPRSFGNKDKYEMEGASAGNQYDDSSSILPHDSRDDTAAVISSDCYDSISIKSEPLDEVEEIL